MNGKDLSQNRTGVLSCWVVPCKRFFNTEGFKRNYNWLHVIMYCHTAGCVVAPTSDLIYFIGRNTDGKKT